MDWNVVDIHPDVGGSKGLKNLLTAHTQPVRIHADHIEVVGMADMPLHAEWSNSGRFIECLVIALVFAAASSAVGLVIASIARSEDGAVWIAVFFTMATTMLGGTFFTIPEGSVLYTISRLSINTYANAAFNTVIAHGGHLADAGLELAVLAGVIAGGLILSRILFRAMPGGR